MAEEVEYGGWRSRIRWPKESNPMAEGDECDDRRRLKQTTTSGTLSQHRAHCISFDSYIKPQLLSNNVETNFCCISFDPYIKPQREREIIVISYVVYLLIPTSNHNSIGISWSTAVVVYLLIPTSNHNYYSRGEVSNSLYIFWSLHQTTTNAIYYIRASSLYIFWSLHQTTTSSPNICASLPLYIFWSLHQTTTAAPNGNITSELYIFWSLHQTTTCFLFCINQYSLYIF